MPHRFQLCLFMVFFGEPSPVNNCVCICVSVWEAGFCSLKEELWWRQWEVMGTVF